MTHHDGGQVNKETIVGRQELPINKIVQGDTLEVLETFPNDCIDTIITSPPYW